MHNKIKEACDYFANTDAISTPIMHGRVLAEAVFAADPTSKAGDVRNAALEAALEKCEKRLHRDFNSTFLAVTSCMGAIRALKTATPSLPPQGDAQAFQQRVAPWMQEAFGPEIAADTMERNHRFFEESAELVQANGMTCSEAHQLVDYTFGRPVGEPVQEVGGVMVTLAALCLASGLDMHAAGETELARINNPVTMAKIRAKQAAKPKHSPLPAAIAPQGQQAKAVAPEILSGMNDALCDFAIRWSLNGDWLTCKECKYNCIASKADQAFQHSPTCKVGGGVEAHPWRTLTAILSPLYISPTAQALPVADTASADALRLDWIANQDVENLLMMVIKDAPFDGKFYVEGDNKARGYGDTLREAIDAALQQTQGSGA